MYNVKLYRLLSICSYWLIAFTDLLAVNDLKHQHGSKKNSKPYFFINRSFSPSLYFVSIKISGMPLFLCLSA